MHLSIETKRKCFFSVEACESTGGLKEVDRVNRIMHFLKEHFEREGIDCRLVDSKGSADVLVAELNADVPGAPLLLSGHCDTVFPSGSYPEDPFHIEDGFARGPGVLDMKCGVAQIFYLLVALKHFGYRDRPSLKAILVGDEVDEPLWRHRRPDPERRSEGRAVLLQYGKRTPRSLHDRRP